MADITIRMIYNKETGKNDIVIEYESDDDVLWKEHEQEHEKIVEKVLGQKLKEMKNIGEITIERVKATKVVQEDKKTPQGGEQALRNREG